MGEGWRRRGSAIEARVTVAGKVYTRTFPGDAAEADIQAWRAWVAAARPERVPVVRRRRPQGKARTVAPGVVAEPDGYRVQVWVYGVNVTKRFPASTPREVVEAWADGVRTARDRMKERASHAVALADAIRADEAPR